LVRKVSEKTIADRSFKIENISLTNYEQE